MASEKSHNISALTISSKEIDVHLQNDSSYPHLIDCFKKGGIPSLSGLNERDYTSLDELSRLHFFPLLNSVKKVPLPAELVEQFGRMKDNCQMGLFPEISRAWLIIDSDIFIWSFEDSMDLIHCDKFYETVMSVGLVKPKEGIFASHINYLLCVTTSIEIVLLGVSLKKQYDTSPPFGELILLPEPLFSRPAGNTSMVTIQATHDGRIFLGGNDGAIYEFAYQTTSGWFYRTCEVINHSSGPWSFLVPSFLNSAFSENDAVAQIAIDDLRHILYSRSEKGAIQVFDLGNDGKQMSKVALVSQAHIVESATSVAKNIDKSLFHPIVHVSIVERRESTCVHLVAVTQSGVRLYFTTNPELKEMRPLTLTLLHVRFPPGFSALSSPVRPSYVHISHYKKGCLLLSSSQADDQYVVWGINNDSFPSCSDLVETYTTIPLDGHTWALCEMPPSYTSSEFNGGYESVPIIASDPPLVVTQHMELPRKFIFLSPQGTHIITKPRPVDLLRKLLIDSSGPDSDAVKAFFFLHKEVQACAMCLILACSQSPQEKQIAEMAARAFFLYGGEPRVRVIPSTDMTSGVESSFTSSPDMISSTRYPVQSSILLSQELTSSGATVSSSGVIYSGKHDGLYLYFSRIIRSLWNTKLVADAPVHCPENQKEFLSSVSSKALALYHQETTALKNFVNFQALGNVSASSRQNYSSRQLGSTMLFLSSGNVSSVQMQTQQKMPPSDAELQERISLIHLQQLVNNSCEMLGLWKILCDSQFHTVVSMIPQELQNQLRVLTFKDFVINGKEISGALMYAVIGLYLNDHASTNDICEKLRDVCPSIYHEEDATISKACENLLIAKDISNKAEKEKELKEALEIYKVMIPHLNLSSICNVLQRVHYYNGIVDLCLCAAQHADPQGVALQYYYKLDKTKDDQQGLQAYDNRMKYYNALFDSMSYLMSLSISHPRNISEAPEPGAGRDPNVLSPEEAKNYSEQMFEMALKTDDELFHFALYDWLIDNNQTDTLISIQSSFLEMYLHHRCNVMTENLSILELLLQYYEKRHNFGGISRVLAKLADRPGITLAQRLEYMSRAMLSMKNSDKDYATNDREFLQELEEKMELGLLQRDILGKLPQEQVCNAEVLAMLNSRIWNAVELYKKFAKPFDLTDVKISLCRLSGVINEKLISVWYENIIDRAACSSTDVDTIRSNIESTVTMLAVKFKKEEKYFPMKTIVRHLEMKACIFHMEISWVYRLLLLCGISPIVILNCYHDLYNSSENLWINLQKPHHLTFVLASFISHVVTRLAVLPDYERSLLQNTCVTYLNQYKTDFLAMDSGDATVTSILKLLNTTFKTLQSFGN